LPVRKGNTTIRMLIIRKKFLKTRLIKDKPKLFEWKMGKLVFLNKEYPNRTDLHFFLPK